MLRSFKMLVNTLGLHRLSDLHHAPGQLPANDVQLLQLRVMD
jgi:hypothetical protein